LALELEVARAVGKDRAELTGQLRYVREWGGNLVVAVPRLEIF